MRSLFTCLAIVGIGLLASGPPQANAFRVRCGILSFLGNDRACRASCWIRGKQTGLCDENNECKCGKKALDIPDTVTDLLGGLDVLEYVKIKAKEFAEEVGKLDISEDVKSLIPSRCRIGNGFCETTCRGIGRRTGTCNQDFSDCECSEESVTPKEFALCMEEGICSVYCQRKDYARGECRGPGGWTCECISLQGKKDDDETTITVVNMDDDYEEFY